jgi:hypothetical protein
VTLNWSIGLQCLDEHSASTTCQSIPRLDLADGHLTSELLSSTYIWSENYSHSP